MYHQVSPSRHSQDHLNVPRRSTSNQIDHIVIGRRNASSVLDVHTFRGPNLDSDYYLVAAKFRLRISASRSARFSAAETFSTQLSDKLRRSPYNLSNIGRLWTNISHSFRTSAETALGFERPPHRNGNVSVSYDVVARVFQSPQELVDCKVPEK